MNKHFVLVVLLISLLGTTAAIAADGCSGGCGVAGYEQLVFSPVQIEVVIDSASPVVKCYQLQELELYVRKLCLCCDDGSGGMDCFYVTTQTDDPDAVVYAESGCKFWDKQNNTNPGYDEINESHCMRTTSNPCQ